MCGIPRILLGTSRQPRELERATERAGGTSPDSARKGRSGIRPRSSSTGSGSAAGERSSEMWRLWIAAVLTGLTMAPEACADTVYLRDGQTVWGLEVVEQGGAVLVERADGDSDSRRLMLPRSNEPQISIPPFYAQPGTEYPTPPVATAQKPAGESATPSNGREAASEAPATEPPPSPPIVSPPPPPTLGGPWSPRY